LFNLAKKLGLEAEKSALVNPTELEPTSEHEAIANTALPTTRHFLQVKTEQIKTLRVTASNDELLPAHYYKADNLTFWKTPHSVVELLRYKYSDAAWIQGKLRRVPANQRQKLAEEYSIIYKNTFDTELNPIKKNNMAALAANSWLRQATDHIRRK
jgi:hypothetical protein